MNDFKQMDVKGKKVMALRSIIQSIVILAIFTIFIVINTVWLDLLSNTAIKWVAAIAIIIIILNSIIGLVIGPRYRYLIFKYQLSDEEVVVRTGLWFISTKKIPLFRIQNVEVQEGMIMRKYNLANVSLSTAGGNGEIKLVTKHEANKIKQHIKDVTRENL